jgi:hypothetical protein
MAWRVRYGRRLSGPQVGAIAVMGRRGGGHGGVVSGIDARGNPITISGNHGHKVGEDVYPRRRVCDPVSVSGSTPGGTTDRLHYSGRQKAALVTDLRSRLNRDRRRAFW